MKSFINKFKDIIKFTPYGITGKGNYIFKCGEVFIKVGFSKGD